MSAAVIELRMARSRAGDGGDPAGLAGRRVVPQPGDEPRITGTVVVFGPGEYSGGSKSGMQPPLPDNTLHAILPRPQTNKSSPGTTISDRPGSGVPAAQ
jgi:hypothetical protein